MPIRIVQRLEALDDQLDAMKRAYAESCPEVRAQPGVLEFELYESIERPGQFVVLQRYADEQALANHGNLVVHRGLQLDSVRRITARERRDE
jgi:quinol monooxygenase YgiN